MSKLLTKSIQINNKQKTTTFNPYNFFISSTVERCHPHFNGYRENIVCSDKNGIPIFKKIIFNCIKCSVITDALYKNKKTSKRYLKKIKKYNIK